MNKLLIPVIFLFIFTTHSVSAQTVGEILTGQYNYTDTEGDLEGTSTFQWYRDNIAIPGATSITYLITTLDKGKTLLFEVTPVALTGISPGIPIRSDGIFITDGPSSAPRFIKSGYLPGYGSIGTIITTPTPPATTTIVTATPFISTKLLKFNTTYPDVKLLQIYLNTHGFPVSLSGPGSRSNETNYFGSKTKAAVIEFQRANDLRPDGIVGQMTRGKMR